MSGGLALMADASQAWDSPSWGNESLFAVVEQWSQGASKVPLRNVASYLGTGGGVASPLTTVTAGRLGSQGCSVLLVGNDSTLNGGTVGSRALGQADAQTFMRQAAALGCTGGNVYLVADIEDNAQVRANLSTLGQWYLGWVTTNRASNYGGAGIVYTSPSIAAAILEQALAQAQNAQETADVQRGMFWIAAWQNINANGTVNTSYPYLTADNLPAFDPASLLPSAPGQVVAWQYAAGVYGGIADLSVLDLDKLPPGQLWSPKADGAPLNPATAPQSGAGGSGGSGGTPQPAPTGGSGGAGGSPAPSPAPSPTPTRALIAKIQGTIDPATYQFTFSAKLTGPNGPSQMSDFLLDTGAFEMLLTPATASALSLPQGGSLQIQGVTGSAQAYNTEVGLALGGQTFDINAIVDPSMTYQLFGLRFLITRGYLLELDTKAATLTIYGPLPS